MYRRERVQHSLEVLLSLCVSILGKHVENLRICGSILYQFLCALCNLRVAEFHYCVTC